MDRDQQLNTVRNHTRFTLLRLVSLMGLGLASTLTYYRVTDYELFNWAGISILLVAFSTGITLLLFRKPEDYNKAVTTLATAAYILSTIWIFTGGESGTGLYWTYPCLCITLFTTRFRFGLALFVLFMLGTGLSWQLHMPWVYYDYTDTQQIRYLSSMALLGLLALSREYTVDQSMVQIDTLRQALDNAANTDSLTGLLNRRFVYEHCIDQGRFVAGASREFAILLADIDHFKQVNDTHGHDIGDAALKLITTVLRDATRSSDVLARWGGEEFLIMLPDVSQEIALKRAQQFIENVAAQPLKLDNSEINLTISIGIARSHQNISAKDVLKEADDKLYQAKTEGRNRVCY